MDKEALLRPRLPEGEVEIDGVGTVRVRGLSRAEVLAFGELDGATRECQWFAAAMVEPKLTEAEVEEWRKAASYDEMEKVSEKIAELSGMLKESPKEAYKSVPEGSDD